MILKSVTGLLEKVSAFSIAYSYEHHHAVQLHFLFLRHFRHLRLREFRFFQSFMIMVSDSTSTGINVAACSLYIEVNQTDVLI